MVETFHIAAQYLATVAIVFLEAKEDDSHTNLGWKNGVLHTHSLNDHNCMLSLDYKSFSLIWTNDLGYRKVLSLDGKKHSEIIIWIRQTSLKAGNNEIYEYKLHYELPYGEMESDFVFKKPSDEEIEKLIQQRDLAQEALENALKINNQNTPIRIWPHHFDSGSFFMINETTGIGVGMAIPDEMINDFYLYTSSYKGHNFAEISSEININKGKYYDESWKGFALPVSGLSKEEAINFYKETINIYL